MWVATCSTSRDRTLASQSRRRSPRSRPLSSSRRRSLSNSECALFVRAFTIHINLQNTRTVITHRCHHLAVYCILMSYLCATGNEAIEPVSDGALPFAAQDAVAPTRLLLQRYLCSELLIDARTHSMCGLCPSPVLFDYLRAQTKQIRFQSLFTISI